MTEDAAPVFHGSALRAELEHARLMRRRATDRAYRQRVRAEHWYKRWQDSQAELRRLDYARRTIPGLRARIVFLEAQLEIATAPRRNHLDGARAAGQEGAV